MYVVRGRVITFPNALSLSRILLTPVFLYLCAYHHDQAALIIFFIASMTDWADGYFARLTACTSEVGKILDPIADKILLMAAYAGFYALGRLPLWLVVLVLARDGLIILLGTLALLRQWSLKLDVHYISKINTMFQMLLIGGVILLGQESLIVEGLIFITAVTTVASGFSYGRHFQRWYTS